MTPEDERDQEETAAVTRRHFMQWAGKVGLGTAAATAMSGSVLAACAKGKSSSGGSGGGSSDLGTIKIGVVAPFSGIAAFIGQVVNRSLDAATAELNANPRGLPRVQLVLRDTGVDPTNGPKVYNDLASQNVAGILWCFGAGFDPQTLPLIKRDNMPVVSVFNDLSSTKKLFPDGDAAGRSVFQLSDDGRVGSQVAMDYLKNDRGYSTVGYMYDTALDPQGDGKKIFQETATAAGLTITGIETFQVQDADYGPQLQRLKAQKPHCLVISGLSGNTAGIVKQLASLNASYVDTPTAKGGEWHPQILGSPGGTGDKSWVELAGDAAKVGTNTVWHVSGLIGTPGFPIADWSRKYKNVEVTGGEEVPADGLFALLSAVKKAGSTDHAKVIDALETQGKLTFASIDFEWTKDRHLAHTKDDMVMITMERGGKGPATTDPPYELGQEWKTGIFKSTSAGPTHLVRPTLEANKRAHPDVMQKIIDGKYGTQCTKHADGSLGKECKIH
jgi:branched-chain amino acid transport system substrate-binding protein